MKLNFSLTVFLTSALALASSGFSQEEAVLESLNPVMNVANEVAYQSDFEVNQAVDKSVWQKRQGTQWKIVDGVLRGEQSTPEYQPKKDDHKGYDPRIKSLKTPREFIAKFSLRFIGGTETKLLPIIEFGHHNVRLKFSESGTVMLADHEQVQLAQSKELKLELGRWYHVLAERQGDEFVVQFANGPTFYAKHKSLAIPVADDADGLGIAGTRKGTVEIDNVTLWSIKESKKAKSWRKTVVSLKENMTEPILIEKKSKKSKQKKSKNLKKKKN
jgi:hypothetical protein